MNVSVIVPTYNRPGELRLCLRSLARQSVRPAEVLVADDGSGPPTRELIEALQRELRGAFPLRHVWHEDLGFRKPKILNETVRRSSGEYLVFLDGDCMAHRHFVRAHVEASAADAILSGKRVDLGRRLSEKLLAEGRVLNRFSLALLKDALGGPRPRSRKVEEAIVLRSPWLRRLFHRDAIPGDGVWGCNFSLCRDLFYAINGCDEDFRDGSVEDNDLGIRVLNRGDRLRSVRNRAVVFHLWHQPTWNPQSEKYRHNLAILRRRIAKREPFCVNGIVRRAG